MIGKTDGIICSVPVPGTISEKQATGIISPRRLIYPDKGRNILSRASGTPFVELPRFALRSLEPEPVFDPFVDESRAKRWGRVPMWACRPAIAPVNQIKKEMRAEIRHRQRQGVRRCGHEEETVRGYSKAVFTSYHYYAAERIVLDSIMPVIVLRMKLGASTEQKRRIVKEFTSTMVATMGIEPELVTILIDELPPENIGKAGKLRCDP